MTSHIETIRAKCIEANPEIVELKFGCNVIAKKSNKTLTISGYYEGDPLVLDYFRGFPQVVMVDGYMNNDLVEIIGRPIRLADVLYTLSQWRKLGTKNHSFLGIFPSGEFKNDDGYNGVDDKGIYWNLREDDLERQSPETLEFIAKLLS